MFFQVAKTLRIAPFQYNRWLHSGLWHSEESASPPDPSFCSWQSAAAKSGKDQQEDKNRDDNITQI